MNDPKVEKQPPVPPFVQFCCAAIPQVFDDSLSYYEALCAMWKYLDNTVKVINNNAMITEDFIAKVNELHDYVENYFANLDVQEEINNKLDQMAEDGTLQEIITTYIQANVAWTFDTVADMKSATNLIAGSYAQTLGFHTLNDGGGAIYKISDSGTANEMDIIAIGSLYANLVISDTLNIKQVGAKCDGETDDSDVIQRCVNIIGSNTKVVIFNNTYPLVITKPIVLDGIKNVDFLFKGKIHRSSSAATSSMFTLVDCENLNFENLYIYSERDQNEEAPSGHTRVSPYGSNINGVYMRHVKNICFNGFYGQNLASDFFNQWSEDYESSDNVIINNWVSQDTSLPLFMQYITNVKIDNAHVVVAEDMGTGDHFLYFSKNVKNVIVSNSYFKSPDNNFGVSVAFANSGDDATEENCPRHLKVYNCYFENARHLGILRFISDASYQNCEFNFTGSPGFYSLFDSPTLVIDNCKIYGTITSFYSANNCAVDLTIKNSLIKFATDPNAMFESVGGGANIKVLNNEIYCNKTLVYCSAYDNSSTITFRDNIINLTASSSVMFTNKNANNIINIIGNRITNANPKTNLIWCDNVSCPLMYVYFNIITGYSAVANATDIQSINNADNYFV